MFLQGLMKLHVDMRQFEINRLKGVLLILAPRWSRQFEIKRLWCFIYLYETPVYQRQAPR